MIVLNSSFSQIFALVFLVIYILFFIYTLIRILLDTHSTPKTLGYILLVIVLPGFGMYFYYAFGINYRHMKNTRRGVLSHKLITKEYLKYVTDPTIHLIKKYPRYLEKYKDIVSFIHKVEDENLDINTYKLLVNGEEKFPEVLKIISTANQFIHMEYYDWENDTRGNQIKDALIDKLKQGVKVRVMFDDYASRKIKHNIVRELKAAGAEMYPVIIIKLVAFASRLNHRDHRKLIIVDGYIGFVGGINISDRYDNSIDTGLFWRDTHVKITGATVQSMQRHFLVNWNTCQPNKLLPARELFPQINAEVEGKNPEFAQVVAGGPIYPLSNIMLTYFKLFMSAKEKLYITNPYFIPSDSILNTIKLAALSGVDVRLLLPEKSDSTIVGFASKFHYAELLQVGVRIFLYKKGFVHAKTVVVDGDLSVVGTANLDIRSFDLNFEMMSVIYGKKTGEKLQNIFLEDLKCCREIYYDEWIKQSTLKKLSYATARLISSFL